MYKRRTRSKMLIGAVAMIMLAAGCSSGSGDGEGAGDGTPQRGGTITMAHATESRTMDPAKCATGGWSRCAPVFGTLLRYDSEKQEFIGDLAKSFETTDGKVWKLTLREGVLFSDGTPLDAEAVVTNWDRIRDPATLSPSAPVTAGLTWKVVDPLTVEVASDTPNFQLAKALTLGLGMIGSPTAMKKLGEDFGSAPVGAGPYVLDKWVRNAQAEFSRNDGYWDEGLPYADKFVIKVIPQEDQRLNALRTGEVDYAYSLSAKDAKTMEAEGYPVLSVQHYGGTGLMTNFNDADLKGPQLRQAILHAFNSDKVTDVIDPSDVNVDAFMFPGSDYRDNSLGTYPEFDLAKAQQLFDNYLAATGKSSLTLTLATLAGVPTYEKAGQIVQSQLQEIDGLTIELKPADAATIAGNIRTGNFQLALYGSLAELPDALYDFFHSEGWSNVTGYSNPKVDEALETTRRSQDQAEVTQAYKVASGEISKEAPLRIWGYSTGHLFTSKKLKGLSITGSDAASAYLDRAWINN